MTQFNTLAPVPPMGWNSYDCFGAQVREEDVLANARYLAEHLKPLGWEYVVIDISWHVQDADMAYDARGQNSAGRPGQVDAFGRLLPAPDRFPCSRSGAGFKPLADQIHQMGLKFGIHVLPGIPEWAIQQKLPVKGSASSAADIVYDGLYNKLAPGFLRRLDMTKSGAQEYVNSQVELYAEWGVDFLKLDGIGLPYLPDVVEAFDRARNTIDREIVLSVSACFHDYQNYRQHRKRHCEMWRVSEDLWDRWDHLEMMLYTLPRWQGDAGPGHWPDADMLPLGRIGIRQHPLNSPDRMTRLTHPEQRAMMTLWCVAQCPLMVGAHLPSNDAWTHALLSNQEVIAVNQTGGNARELFKDCHQSTSVWRCDLPDHAYALAVFSFDGKRARQVSVRHEEAGFPSRVHIRDLWSNQDLGVFEDTFTTEIEPHGAGLYKVTALAD